MQRLGRRRLTGQRVVPLGTTRRQNGGVDAGKLLDLPGPAKDFIDGNEPGTGHSKREQQYQARSEEHTSELQSLMRISYAVFCLKKKNKNKKTTIHQNTMLEDSTQHEYKILTIAIK